MIISIFVFKDAPKYDWKQDEQGYILSSFYIGYFITHIPGGILAENFGGKWTLSLGIFVIIVITAVTPLAIEFGKLAKFMAHLDKIKKRITE